MYLPVLTSQVLLTAPVDNGEKAVAINQSNAGLPRRIRHSLWQLSLPFYTTHAAFLITWP